jgi:tRNA (guanine37-N1)-methyltransferase
MEFHILTIFPGMFESPFRWGVVARALEKNTVRISVHDIRRYAEGPHRTVDDYPYGGGEGMVMKPEPLFAAVEDAKAQGAPGPVILLTPQGDVLNHALARELASLEGMILLCGRYEGVDERVIKACVDKELSLGDYVLTGGELAAMVVIDAVARLIEGVLGNEASSKRDSFETCRLKYPQFTRPPVFRDMRVPSVLLSGHHREIERWRRNESLKRTLHRRPDLLKRASLSSEEMQFLEEIQKGSSPGNGE